MKERCRWRRCYRVVKNGELEKSGMVPERELWEKLLQKMAEFSFQLRDEWKTIVRDRKASHVGDIIDGGN